MTTSSSSPPQATECEGGEMTSGEELVDCTLLGGGQAAGK